MTDDVLDEQQLPLDEEQSSDDGLTSQFQRVARGAPVEAVGDEEASPPAGSATAEHHEFDYQKWYNESPDEVKTFIDKVRNEEQQFAEVRERLAPIQPLLEKAYADENMRLQLAKLNDQKFYDWTFKESAEVYNEYYSEEGDPEAGERGSAQIAAEHGAPLELVNRLAVLEQAENTRKTEALAKQYVDSRIEEYRATAREIPALDYWTPKDPVVVKKNQALAKFITDYVEKESRATGVRLSYKEAYERFAAASEAREQPPHQIAATSASGPPPKPTPPPTSDPAAIREQMKRTARKAGSFAALARHAGRI